MPLKIIGCGRLEPLESIHCRECEESVGTNGCADKRRELKFGFIVNEE